MLHVLLSLGHYATDLDLIIQPSFRDAFTYAGLIRNEQDSVSLQINLMIYFHFSLGKNSFYPC